MRVRSLSWKDPLEEGLATHSSILAWMLGWIKHKLESRLLGEISITSAMQITPPLWQKVKRN